jgi:hypothetical protein
VAAAAGVLYAASWCGRPAVVFPLRDRMGAVVGAESRYVDGRDQPKARTGGEKRLGVFATPGALVAEPVVVVEAPIDALSLAAAGMPALALGGTSAPDWLARAVAFRRVSLGLDADEAGDRAAPALAVELGSLGAVLERWRPVGVKDWNDALRAHGAAALAAALGAPASGAVDTGAEAAPVPEEEDDLLFADPEVDPDTHEGELDPFVEHLVEADGPPDPALWDEVLARAWARDGPDPAACTRGWSASVRSAAPCSSATGGCGSDRGWTSPAAAGLDQRSGRPTTRRTSPRMRRRSIPSSLRRSANSTATGAPAPPE